MSIKTERVCDLCGNVISEKDERSHGVYAGPYHYKVTVERYNSHNDEQMDSDIDVCADCMEKIINGCNNELKK